MYLVRRGQSIKENTMLASKKKITSPTINFAYQRLVNERHIPYEPLPLYDRTDKINVTHLNIINLEPDHYLYLTHSWNLNTYKGYDFGETRQK